MFKRSENGKLQFTPIEVQAMFDKILSICRTKEEVQWVCDKLVDRLNISAFDTLSQIGSYDIKITITERYN